MKTGIHWRWRIVLGLGLLTVLVIPAIFVVLRDE